MTTTKSTAYTYKLKATTQVVDSIGTVVVFNESNAFYPFQPFLGNGNGRWAQRRNHPSKAYYFETETD
jgi:hypothetical protein